MDYELPTEFDLIVVGTGFVESVLAAAASRAGKKVLHVDSKDYYGGQWASFNLESFQTLDSSSKQPESNSENTNAIGNDCFDLRDFSTEWHIESSATPEGDNNSEDVGEKTNRWTMDKLLRDSRKFNLDLFPKLHFARGDFVELLISSNIARYSEFRSVSRVLTYLNGQLEVVPCSRSDVFANNKVSVIEKRMLMKLFTSLDEERDDDSSTSRKDDKTLRQFLKEKKLTDNLVHYVLYAISMSTDTTSYCEGVKNTKRFLNSLGRYGKTPFLFSMYGSGEIAQGFCRLSAVFGAVYALKQPLKHLVFKQPDLVFDSLVCGDQTIKADNLVIGFEKLPKRLIGDGTIENMSWISRGIFITDKSILASEQEHLTLLLYPPSGGTGSIIVLELGALTGTCPKDLYIVHLITTLCETPKDDFKECMATLFNHPESPSILWSCYFSTPNTNDLEHKIPSGNVYVCPGPHPDLDYDFSVKKAKDIFETMYPNVDFLPRAPDPEEIVIGSEDEEKDEEQTIIEDVKE